MNYYFLNMITFRILFLVSFFLVAFTSVRAQDETEAEREKRDTLKSELDEVVITGTRTFKKIIDIPYSVFRVEKKELLYGRNVTARDILADVPGMFLQTRYGNEVRISIRGFGTRSNTGIRGIRILQDGIPESDPDGETAIDAIDYTSLGGVEVVKGNLSSLYSNSPGGVVNFLSDINFEKNFIKQTNTFGEFGLKQNGLKFGVADNKSRLFTSYSYRSNPGYREHSGEYLHLVNSVYQAYIDNKTTLSLLGNYARGISRIPGSLTKEEFEDNPQQAYFQAVSSDFRRITQKGRLGVRYNKLFGKNDLNEFEVLGYGAIKELDFTTNFNYIIKNKNVLGSSLRFTNRSELIGRDNEFTTGFDYSFVTGPLTLFNNVGGSKGNDLQSENQETQNNYAFFFQDQIDLYKSKFSLLLSGRYDKIIFDNDDMLFGIRNSSRAFEKFTPKAALNYKITPKIAFYTSYGFGFDSPSASELENYPYSSNSGSTTLNPDINPQKSRNFELGIKGTMMNKHSEIFRKAFFEATFFNTVIDDEIVPFIISDKAYFRNAAQTNRTGFEMGVKTEPLDHVDMTFNYTFTDFKYNKYIARTYDAVGNPVDADFSGSRVPSVPQHQLNFILEYENEIAEHLEALFLFDCDYVGKMYVDDQNSESTEPYFYANGMIGLNYIQKDFNILLSTGVNNFLNKKYVGFINVNANPEFTINQRRYYEPGEPRSFYLNLNFSYRY
ncbi:TonB-dependent receptor PqqU [soil metagenome]